MTDSSNSDLTRLALIFQKNEIDFVLIGARAAAFYGHVRATEDIDLLISDTRENIEKTIKAIKEIYPHLDLDLTVEDFYESKVVKILDEPELDVSITAWSLTYEQSQSDHKHVILDSVSLPILGIDSLIKSKMTMREQDQWDVKVLSEIKKQNQR